jgi:D-alanyl-lipoteichoic acid acyltransferase DltB (MBOAT superfamily)
MFMKLVIADRIAIVVDSVFDDIPAYGFITVMLASLFYTLQIYCDFAGYTNSMIGISTMFGLELTQNFRTPYFSESTVEFWRKWHISLSIFLKDYIYIPLGGNRKGEFRKMLNTLAVFFVCGMWHGAGLSFIVWGLMHGFFNIITNHIKDTKAGFLVKGITGKIVTFCLVSFAWIFFRADSLSTALHFIKGMIPGLNSLSPLEGLAAQEYQILGISTMEWWIAALSILLLTAADYFASRRKTVFPALMLKSWGDYSRAIFLAVITVVILIFGKYGSGEAIRAFVYQSF